MDILIIFIIGYSAINIKFNLKENISKLYMAFYVPYFVGLSMISYIGNSLYNSPQPTDVELVDEPVIIRTNEDTITCDYEYNVDRPYIITKGKPITGMILCNNCDKTLPKTRFSKSQLKKKNNYRCKVCCKLC